MSPVGKNTQRFLIPLLC